jgi:hypothetical protein
LLVQLAGKPPLDIVDAPSEAAADANRQRADAPAEVAQVADACGLIAGPIREHVDPDEQWQVVRGGD